MSLRRGHTVRAPRRLRCAGWAAGVWIASVLLVSGCETSEPPQAAATPSDDVLRERVESALAAASDLPSANIEVEVGDGVVTLTASDLCEGHDCPGRGTPGGIWTVNQHIGAVVRAVPGVRDVRLSLGLEPAPSGTEPD